MLNAPYVSLPAPCRNARIASKLSTPTANGTIAVRYTAAVRMGSGVGATSSASAERCIDWVSRKAVTKPTMPMRTTVEIGRLLTIMSRRLRSRLTSRRIAIAHSQAATSPSPRKLAGFAQTATNVSCSASATTSRSLQRRVSRIDSHGACRS